MHHQVAENSEKNLKKYVLDSKTNRVFNFYPGPSMLPTEVLNGISSHLYNWRGLGLNPMEIGHRSRHFIELHQQIIFKLKKLLSKDKNFSDHYEILLVQGGATAQYAAIPLNLMANHNKASYVYGGHWSKKAIAEFSQIYGNERLVIAANANDFAMKKLPKYFDWQFDPNSAYTYFTANETIHGLAYLTDPNQDLTLEEVRKLPPLVCDFTSSLFTQEIDINRYGLIFASAQKCLGIAGVTLVVISKDLLARAPSSKTPSILNYLKLSQTDSMLNTPATFSWYVMDLVLDWIIDQGGVQALHQNNLKKSNLIYDAIDNSDFYHNQIDRQYRSIVNVCFNLPTQQLETIFVQQAEVSGLIGLKGHRALGGIRASMYNAMPLIGAKNLLEFMNEFERKYG